MKKKKKKGKKKETVSKAAAPKAASAPVIHLTGEKTFDGKSVVEFEELSKIKTARTMTWSAWVNPSSDGTVMALTGAKGKWLKGGVTLFIKGGRLNLDIGWVGTFKGPGGLSDGKWHHVAMTQVENGIHFYLDGKLHSSHSCRIDPSIKGLDRFKIGFTNTDFPQPSYFVGQMKNVAVYDYAMTDEGIKKLYDEERG